MLRKVGKHYVASYGFEVLMIQLHNMIMNLMYGAEIYFLSQNKKLNHALLVEKMILRFSYPLSQGVLALFSPSNFVFELCSAGSGDNSDCSLSCFAPFLQI